MVHSEQARPEPVAPLFPSIRNEAGTRWACAAFVSMLWKLLDMASPLRREWWLDAYLQVAQQLETDSQYTPRGGRFLGYRGPAWKYVQEAVHWACEQNLPALEARKAWCCGACLLETIPSVLYILIRYAADLEGALIRAANQTQENDTTAIVGPAVGALHGESAIPQRWINRLSGRIAEHDDRRISQLIDRARAAFWES